MWCHACVYCFVCAPRRFALINFGRAVKKTNEFEFQIWRNNNGKNKFLPSRIIFVCLISIQKVHKRMNAHHLMHDPPSILVNNTTCKPKTQRIYLFEK
jgi:hypothetical protein